MFCWQARRWIARLAGAPVASSGSPDRKVLEDHIASCARCRARSDRLGRLSFLMAQSAPRLHLDGKLFEDRLMREIRTRAAHSRLRPAGRPDPVVSFTPWPGLRPAALVVAVSLMAASGALALLLGGQPMPREAIPTDSVAQTATQMESGDDLVAAPREIPFTVEMDLVGERRGTIPLTTYVLEPAPRPAAVMRASL
jgi:hypothetical protein